MIRLTGITWDHPRGYAPLEASTRLYGEIADVTVRWDRRSLKDFGDASVESLAARCDLLVLDHPHIGEAGTSGCLAPLDAILSEAELAELEAQSAGPSFASYRYAGRQWALPVDAAVQCASRRADLWDEPPGDWDAALAVAGRLRRQGLWMAIPLCPTDAVCTFLTLCAQLGDPPREGRPALTSPDTGREVLELIRRLSEVAHPMSLGANPIRVYEAMARGGEIAFCPLAFCYSHYATAAAGMQPLRFGPPPLGVNAVLGGAGIAVSASCAHPEAAARYAHWLCREEQQAGFYVKAGGQPGNGAAWQSLSADEITTGFFTGVRPALRSAYTRPRMPGWPQLQEHLGNRIHRFLTDGHRADAVMKEIERDYGVMVGR